MATPLEPQKKRKNLIFRHSRDEIRHSRDIFRQIFTTSATLMTKSAKD